MRIAIVMPKLSYDMESARMGEWSKQLGDRVARGETVGAIETEKAAVDLEAPASGRLVEIVHGAGDEVAVGQVIGYIEADT